jgi:hypothetical protein
MMFLLLELLIEGEMEANGSTIQGFEGFEKELVFNSFDNTRLPQEQTISISEFGKLQQKMKIERSKQKFF